VEILRGSGSSIYGTHAIGGVVNLIRRTEAKDLHLDGGFEGGTLSTFRERLMSSGGGERFGFTPLEPIVLDVRKGIDGRRRVRQHCICRTRTVQPDAMHHGQWNVLRNIANARVNDSPFALPSAFTGGLFPAPS
jgi:hypothetical protein